MTNPNAEVSIVDGVAAQFEAEPLEPEVEEPEGQPDADGEGESGGTGNDSDEVAEEIVEELFELELDGEKTRVPKKFKDAFLRNADYTQKTQSISDKARFLAEREQVLEVRQQVSAQLESDKFEYAVLHHGVSKLEHDIQQAIAQQDPAQVAILNAQYNFERNKLDQKSAEINKKSAEFEKLIEYDNAQRMQRADKEAAERIPNFSQQTKAEMVNAARKVGYQDLEIKSVADPRAYELLWKASQWDKLQQAKPQITKKAVEAPKTLSAKGSNQQGNEAKVEELRAKFKKTGASEDMRRYLDAKHKYRKR